MGKNNAPRSRVYIVYRNGKTVWHEGLTKREAKDLYKSLAAMWRNFKEVGMA